MKINIPANIAIGRGYYKLNMQLMDNPDFSNEIKSHIESIKDKVDWGWNPHQIWEYYKMEIRNIFQRCGACFTSNHRRDVLDSEKEYNYLVNLYNKKLVDPNSTKVSSEILAESVEVLAKKLEDLRKIEAERLLFRSKLNYINNGEKCTKYFLNMLKRKEKRLYIPKINIENTTFNSSEMGPEILKFYANLYKQDEGIDRNTDMFLSVIDQKLSEDQKTELDREITLDELYIVIKSCKDSAPGLDAIPYSLYKIFWPTLGTHLLNSWNYSVRVGHLSQDQKHSVISLLQKPGKPVGSIDNLRPISLSNCDIKLITKLLTSRVLKCPNIFSSCQTAYVPGRRITDNLLTIDKLLKECDRLETGGYLMSLDAKKAFDSIDHEFMYRTLSKFNFSKKFIDIIRTLYNDLTADVMVNGIRYGILKIRKGVKQGDALSCVLFILCMEPLMARIRNNANIIGCPLGNNVIKQVTFADDLSPTVRDRESIQQVLNEYSKFSTYSGIKLNHLKTEILPLGSCKNDLDPIPIEYDGSIIEITPVNCVKIGGIWFGYNRDLIREKNIISRIEKLKKILNSWAFAKFTLEGNIIIAKTFGLSQFIHLMQIIHIELTDLKKIESLLYKFIWRGTDRVKRKVLMSNYDQGGLKAPDPIKMNFCLKLKAFFRYLNYQMDHPIGRYLKDTCLKDHVNSVRDINEKEYNKSLLTNTDFVVSCISAFHYYNFLWKSHVTGVRPGDPCHIQYKLLFAKADITSIVNTRSRAIANRLKNVFGINNLVELLSSNNQNIYLEKASIIRQIPEIIKNSLSNNLAKYQNEILNINLNLICKGLNSWTNYKLFKTFDIEYLRSGLKVTPELDNFFIINRLTTKNVMIRDFQFKVLHNILNTRSMLFKFKFVPDEWCLSCLEAGVQVRDNISHSLYNCPMSSESWINFETICKNDYNVNIELNLDNCIKSFNSHDKLIDEVSIHIKKILHKPVTTRRAVSCEQIKKLFENVNKINEYNRKIKLIKRAK